MAVNPINAGILRTPLDLQVKVKTRDAQGGFSYTWAFMRTLYTAFEDVEGKNSHGITKYGTERPYAGKQRSQLSHLIRCRAQNFDIVPDMRFVENNTIVYNITEVVKLQRIRHMLRIVAIENISNAESASAAYKLVVDDSGNFVVDDDGNYVVAAA